MAAIQPGENWWDWQARKRELFRQAARHAGRTDAEIAEIEARSEGSVPYCLICGEEEEDEGNCVCSTPDLANWTAADIVIAARAGWKEKETP